MRRVLVCGDRNWYDMRWLWDRLDDLHAEDPIACVIEGDATGADRMAGRWAEWRAGVPFEVYPAQWGKYHRAAGPIRNRQMLVEGKPDLVVAFHRDIMASKGTKDMLRQAQRAGVPTLLYDGRSAKPVAGPEVTK